MDRGRIQVGLVSLGCSKNLVDSEVMLGLLEQAGYTLVTELEEADVLIVNTCGFIQSAKEESLETIIQLGNYKERGRCRSLIVTGCLVQGYADELASELPEVDALLGTRDFHRIVEVVEETLQGKTCRYTGSPQARFPGRWPRLLSQAGPSAYLKIAEGCNNHCSYCIIPRLRGPQESRPMEEIIREAEALAQLGVKELIIIAQDTTRYGEDLYGKPVLPLLLRRLAKVEGIHWLRLLYCYPTRFTSELIHVMKEEPKVVKYVDMPLQHANNRILRLMNRSHTKEEVCNLLQTLRQEIPDISIRTTFIVGFPGETEEEFAELLAFLEEQQFDRAGFFTYSREEGTPAAQFPGQIPEREKEARYREAMKVQQAISAARNRQWVGRELEVLVEGVGPEPGVMVGRSYRDAPDIDGVVYVTAPQASWGKVIRARITSATEYDLVGEGRDEPSQ